MKWSEYNQSLVRRGEILLGFDVIDNWHHELQEMNKGKVGEPFRYPNTFLLLLGYAKAYFHLPYRQTEGIVKAHAEGKVPSINSRLHYNIKKDKQIGHPYRWLQTE